MRTIKVRPLVAGLAIGCFAVLATAYVGATGYLIYRDDLLGTAVTRQVEMQYAYEERLAALRAELDRLSSRHMVQTASVESQVAALLHRQEGLLERQSALDELVGKAREAGLDVVAEAPRLPRARPTEPQPSPLLSYAPSQPAADHMITGSLIKTPAETRGALARVSAELEESGDRQAAALDALSSAAEAESERLDEVLSPLGLRGAASEEPQGGPFIPMAGLHFVERVAIVNRMLDDLAALHESAAAMPLARPVSATRVSSRFGSRKDPFLNQQGFHAGIDFAAGPGTAVRATAAGTIVTAGWEGGYGNMVEIRHEGGFSTRYGHLSAVLVSPGDRVEAGETIGRVGSTGRSTGPHLHYETRRGGRAVDPSPYLAAGDALRRSF